MADLTLTGDEVRAIVKSLRGSSNAPQASDYVTATVAYLNRRAWPANSQEGDCKCRRLGDWNGEHHPLCDAAQPSGSPAAPQGDVVGAECERCGLAPEKHTIAHWCDNQSYRLSGSPAALTDAEITDLWNMAMGSVLTLQSRAIAFARALLAESPAAPTGAEAVAWMVTHPELKAQPGNETIVQTKEAAATYANGGWTVRAMGFITAPQSATRESSTEFLAATARAAAFESEVLALRQPATQEARDAVDGLKTGCCHKCGLSLSENPHPEAVKPDHYLEVGCPKECIPCTVKGRNNWASHAMKNQRDAERYRKLRAMTGGRRTPSGQQYFDIPSPPVHTNIMQGSVAQHLDEAIDAMSASKEAGNG